MEVALPSQINYTSQSMVPPDVEQYEVVVRPSNTQTIQPSQQAYFDIACKDFMDPTSIYLRYTIQPTGTGSSCLLGCPVYAPIQQVQT